MAEALGMGQEWSALGVKVRKLENVDLKLRKMCLSGRMSQFASLSPHAMAIPFLPKESAIPDPIFSEAITTIRHC